MTPKSDLASVKAEADKIDVSKLKIPPGDLSNLKNKVHKLNTDKLAPIPVNLM